MTKIMKIIFIVPYVSLSVTANTANIQIPLNGGSFRMFLLFISVFNFSTMLTAVHDSHLSQMHCTYPVTYTRRIYE